MKVLNSFLKRLHPKDKTSWTIKHSSFSILLLVLNSMKMHFQGKIRKKIFPFSVCSVILQHLSHLSFSSSSSLPTPHDKLLDNKHRFSWNPSPCLPEFLLPPFSLGCFSPLQKHQWLQGPKALWKIPKNQNTGVAGAQWESQQKHWKHSMFSVNPDRWSFTIYCKKHWACQFVWKISKLRGSIQLSTDLLQV